MSPLAKLLCVVFLAFVLHSRESKCAFGPAVPLRPSARPGQQTDTGFIENSIKNNPFFVLVKAHFAYKTKTCIGTRVADVVIATAASCFVLTGADNEKWNRVPRLDYKRNTFFLSIVFFGRDGKQLETQLMSHHVCSIIPVPDTFGMLHQQPDSFARIDIIAYDLIPEEVRNYSLQVKSVDRDELDRATREKKTLYLFGFLSNTAKKMGTTFGYVELELLNATRCAQLLGDQRTFAYRHHLVCARRNNRKGIMATDWDIGAGLIALDTPPPLPEEHDYAVTFYGVLSRLIIKTKKGKIDPDAPSVFAIPRSSQ